MEPFYRSEAWRPPFPVHHHHPHHHHNHPMILSSHHHHHHHHHHTILCPLHHHHHLISCHSHLSPTPTPPFPNHLNSGSTPVQKRAHYSGTDLVLQEQEYEGLEEEEGEVEEEEEPIFVLTDEWREFFAKSEAKRKLEKQQAK